MGLSHVQVPAIGREKETPEEAYLINDLCPRQRKGPYPFSSHFIGKKNVTWPNLTASEAGKCSVAKTDYKCNTTEEGENVCRCTADSLCNTA